MFKTKILIVDDEKEIKDIFITAFDGYRIITAASGEEALALLRQPHDIDLVVLDIMLPGLGGIELLREIKKMDSNLKVVIMTGYGTKDLVTQALRLDADDYIEKPFDIEKVKEIFERLLAKSKKFNKEGGCDIKDKIEYVRRFIRRNYNKPISMKDTAAEIFLSPKYFSRVFKEKSGSSFNKYRLNLRIGKAKEFLAKSSYSVGEIADRIGYQNTNSFAKIFKKLTSLTPSQYRSRNRRRK